MNFQKIKAYHLFWITAAIILLIGIAGINNPDSTLDINVHDTYFVIAHIYIAVVLSLFYFLMGLGYWFIQKVFKKQLIKYLTAIHIVILIGSFIGYWLLMLYFKLFPRDMAFPLFDDYQLVNVVLISQFLLIIFIATPLYIINLLIALFSKKKVNN
ncbi:Cytochrome C and Quinol oxidase polypeptide I [Flavobacterium sp. CF108]|uniref:cbb3-type cytochrome c oxidase subunit I n=1 Tax=unclassified Flavobacterium TaxID=196869 RepID=UPI000913B49A|nr:MULTISPECIES: cbb3-type cytochrome c oxidase subunit I [unclassified Flavobacterium]SHH29471.1 Cytochrome C and Quinol oxidase polypeptide I [Flavobacterium sp. CF108]